MAGYAEIEEDSHDMANRTIRTPKKGDRFLDKLRQGYSISAACKAEHIGRRSYYDWRKDDPEFAAMADTAIEEGTDHLEDVARKRAVAPKDGSDTLLIFLLKARRPNTYRERADVNVTGNVGAALTVVFSERPDGPQ